MSKFFGLVNDLLIIFVKCINKGEYCVVNCGNLDTNINTLLDFVAKYSLTKQFTPGFV